eukprot:TRINITY_DN8519_c0_g1_i1.p1 TRINITY_DN8519_c0_g1~~TRINITY_DN8519_c0_g1_i1.p1  ORF type:complete len:115 (+),score=10.54 TRINITY_DN8519_c0_g1_i1:57-401(+)
MASSFRPLHHLLIYTVLLGVTLAFDITITKWGSGPNCTIHHNSPKDSFTYVTPTGIYIDGEPFTVQGVGYSPTPPGFSYETNPHGDFYTSEYKYLYDRDIPLMQQMGVNIVRIW